jgi:hypothetical protein
MRAKEASNEVHLELTTDRQEYLAGEAPRLTASVVNPISEALRVFDPFDMRAGEFGLDARSGEPGSLREWGSMLAEPHSAGVSVDAPTVELGPGQRIEKTLSFPFLRERLHLPLAAGRYRWSFCYQTGASTCAYAEFTVVEPVYLGSAAVRLRTPYREIDPRDGKELQYPGVYMQAHLLEYQGKRYAVVARRPDNDPTVVHPGAGHKLDEGGANEIQGYDRVAEVGAGVTSLAIDDDADGNIVVSWQEPGQRRRAFRLSPDRNRIDEIDR